MYNMKQISIIIALALITTIANAQNITGSHQVRVNDEVKKQQVEYAAVDSTGQGMVWDLSEAEFTKWEPTATYTSEDSRKGIVIGTERGTRNYYRSEPAALMLTGFENNLLKVEYDQPEVQLRMPLVYGDCYEGQFHGTSAYCEKVFSRTFGTYRVVVDGTGSMLLPSGDTLRHVSRVHSTKLISARFFPEVQRERMLKTYVDSIKFPVDSIRLGVVKDTLVVETNTYRWYAAGYRYPVLEVIETGYKGEKPWTTEAFYCAPEDQQQLYDPENEEARKLLADNGGNGFDSVKGGTSDDGGKKNDLGNIMQDLNVTVTGSTVTVGYTLRQDATVTALVCDISGVVYRQQSQTGQTGDHCQMTILCDGLRRGQYVLYMNVNGQVTSQTISL
jgi:hypothetical protein